MKNELLDCTSIIEAADYLRAKDRNPQLSLESFREEKSRLAIGTLLFDSYYYLPNNRINILFQHFIAQVRKKNLVLVTLSKDGTRTQKLVKDKRESGMKASFRVMYGRK